MSSNQALADIFARHQIHVNRYTTGELKKIESLLSRALSDAATKYAEAGTAYGTARYQSMVQSLDRSLREVYAEITDQLSMGFEDFVKYEADYTLEGIRNNISSAAQIHEPDYQRLTSAALESPLRLQGKQHSIPDALSKYANSTRRKVLNEINLASINGESLSEMRQRLNSIGIQSKREVDTLARTINNHLATESRKETLKANEDILEGWRMVATLDSRTTILCAGRDGNVYGWDDPMPPFHYNCRSTISPVVDPKYSKTVEGTRPARGQEGKEDINSNVSYETWLKRQPAEFQRDVLGDGKYEIFREGKLSLDKFVDDNDRELSLEQLKEKASLTL